MSKIYYTYIAYDKDDNFYIGSASCKGNPEQHNYYGSGKAIRSGKFAPVRKLIVDTYKTRELAGLAEMRLISGAKYKEDVRCMNELCAGSNHTKLASYKQSKARAGKNNSMYGKSHSEEAKAKIGKASKGRKHTQEAKAKISKATKGEAHPLYGKSLSEEHKAKISKASKEINHPRFDNRLHKFMHISDLEVIGKYRWLRQNAKILFGFSEGSVKALKMGHAQLIQGWLYCGVLANEAFCN